MSFLKYFEHNQKARDLAADLRAEYLAADRAIQANNQAIQKLIAEPVSRAETMRIFREVIKARADLEWNPELARRIDQISDPNFEERGANSDYYMSGIDPVCLIGTGQPANLAIMSLLGDAILTEVEKRVNAHIPASASLTIQQKKAALAKLRDKGQKLAVTREDALLAYRHLSGDKSARIEP
jgi:hypothetical protein